MSTGPAEIQHSCNIVDSLLEKNGYKNPRAHRQSSLARKKNGKSKGKPLIPLKIKYIYQSIPVTGYETASKSQVYPFVLFLYLVEN